MRPYVIFYLQALIGVSVWMFVGYHSLKAISEGLTKPNYVRFFNGMFGMTAALTLVLWAAKESFHV
jgi:hypothetical protein